MSPHTFAVWSSDPEMAKIPFGEIATQVTVPPCPSIVEWSSWVFSCQTFTKLSVPPANQEDKQRLVCCLAACSSPRVGRRVGTCNSCNAIPGDVTTADGRTVGSPLVWSPTRHRCYRLVHSHTVLLPEAPAGNSVTTCRKL